MPFSASIFYSRKRLRQSFHTTTAFRHTLTLLRTLLSHKKPDRKQRDIPLSIRLFSRNCQRAVLALRHAPAAFPASFFLPVFRRFCRFPLPTMTPSRSALRGQTGPAPLQSHILPVPPQRVPPTRLVSFSSFRHHLFPSIIEFSYSITGVRKFIPISFYV